MSDVIETGSMRKRRKVEPRRDEAIGKKRKIDTSAKIDMSANELELGHFVGDTERKPGPDKNPSGRPSDEGEVVGPKRRKLDSSKTKRLDGSEAKPLDGSRAKPGVGKAEGELSIAAPLAIDDDAPKRRPRARRRSRPIADAGSNWHRLGLFAVLSVLLVFLTGATFLVMPRYDIQGDPLIAPPAFEVGLGEWTKKGLVSQTSDDPGKVVLESLSQEGQTYLQKDIKLPPDDTMVILSAQVQGDDVVTGPEIWDSARIYLAQLDATGKPNWKEEHNLFNLNGTTDIRNYRRSFTMPAEVQTARLGIEMKNATGSLTVTGLELTVVEYKTTFLVAVGCLLASWSVLVLYTGIKTFGGISSVRIKIWLGIVCALSVVALMLPGGFHEAGTEGVNAWLDIGDVGVDAIGHGVMFTVLAFLVRLGRPSDPIWMHVGAWILIAIASEVLQLFTIDRDPSLDDLWVDGIGILLGLSLAEIVSRLRRFHAA